MKPSEYDFNKYQSKLNELQAENPGITRKQASDALVIADAIMKLQDEKFSH